MIFHLHLPANFFFAFIVQSVRETVSYIPRVVVLDNHLVDSVVVNRDPVTLVHGLTVPVPAEKVVMTAYEAVRVFLDVVFLTEYELEG